MGYIYGCFFVINPFLATKLLLTNFVRDIDNVIPVAISAYRPAVCVAIHRSSSFAAFLVFDKLRIAIIAIKICGNKKRNINSWT